ncbi:MAG: hypothetical protein ACK4K7_02315 [Allosphingosinicella sp.]|uniref:M61 family metallopeptidase n=1 Tax=Allosphingosinicella sp. TaxID=2823234 RepID=UPI003939F951
MGWLASLTGAAAALTPIHYQAAPVIGADGLAAVELRAEFDGDADGRTNLFLPDRWAGAERLYERLSELDVEGGRLESGGDPARRIIVHPPGARITVRYRLPLSGADPGLDFQKARPVVRPGWFYIHGEGAFVSTGEPDRPATFRWGAAPDGWRLTSDIEARTALTANEVGGSILFGGTDLRVEEREVGGRPVKVVLRGEWRFSDADLSDTVAAIVDEGNRWLEAEAVPYFVSLVPLDGGAAGGTSTHGTGRTAGFALASTSNAELPFLRRLVAHEYGHRWFGGSFGPTAAEQGSEFWFTEGFGDFAAARWLLRSNAWRASDYLAHLNEVLLRYAASPARNLPNGEIGRRFWDDPAVMQLPYDRGHLFALLLDAEAGGGAVRHALARMARGTGFAPEETQGARFARAFGLAPERLNAMLDGADLVLPQDLLAPCGRIVWAEQPIYATGYTVEERTEGLFFATVAEDHPAWAAGLRPGMRYVKRESFRHGDSTVPTVMRVADAEGERLLSWLPAGGDMVRHQRIEAGAGTDSEACLARIDAVASR